MVIIGIHLFPMLTTLVNMVCLHYSPQIFFRGEGGKEGWWWPGWVWNERTRRDVPETWVEMERENHYGLFIFLFRDTRVKVSTLRYMNIQPCKTWTFNHAKHGHMQNELGLVGCCCQLLLPLAVLIFIDRLASCN